MSSSCLPHRLYSTYETHAEEVGSAETLHDGFRPLLFSVEDAVFASLKDAVLLVDLDMHISFANVQAESFFGYSPAELIAGHFPLLIAERFRTPYVHFWQRRIEDLQTAERGLEVLARDKNGSEFPVEIRVSLLRHDRGVFVLHLIRDLRPRNSILEELRQAQKMEVIGRLAGGVAHDFNNILTIMNGYSEILANRASLDEQAKAMAKEMNKAGERGACITGRLLAFSRRQPVEPQAVHLGRAIQELEPMLRRLVGETVTVTINVADALGHVLADPGQIDQVLLNLVVNARDAMPHGGCIAISAENHDIGESSLEAPTGPPSGQYVRLTVADTGCGMDAETQARMFEPLFTTKPPGKGTGLGLSIVQQVVSQSDGHINVVSKPGHGSSFELFFPRVATETPASKPRRQRPIPRGHEVVLLVEDDDAVRILLHETIQQYGYKVLAAPDPDTALALFRDNVVSIAVIDVVLPNMSGPKLFDLCRVEAPDLRVLYISGYSDETDLSELAPGDPLLLKPFTPSLLALRIRELLDGS